MLNADVVSPDQRRAHEALQVLLGQGLKQKDVAYRLDVSPAMISHINGIHQHPDFHVAHKIVEALEALIPVTRIERAMTLLERWPVVVVETCNAADAEIDDAVRAHIRAAILLGLCGAGQTEASLKFDLPAKVAGALVAIGRDAWLMVRSSRLDPAPSDAQAWSIRGQIQILQTEIRKLHVEIHEKEHLVDHLTMELPAVDVPRVPKADY